LGNQLFQIAATLGIAHRCGLEAVFPPWSFAKWIGVTTLPAHWFEAREWKVRKPADFSYDETLAHRSGDGSISLEGYLQSERYFENCKELVRHAFLTDSTRRIRDQVALRHHVLPTNNDCAVHVRRGDYLKYSNLYPQLTFDGYYLPAMEFMRRERGVRRFLVVSDDPAWCRQHMDGSDIEFSRNVGHFRDRTLSSSRHRQVAGRVSGAWAAYLSRYECLRALRDLFLMSACRNHIIANSSFSWWSSWLSTFNDRAVIAPAEWFLPEMGHNTADLFRPEMMRL